MYDFHKSDLNGLGTANNLVANPLLEFTTIYSLKTGEIGETIQKKARYLGADKFCIIKNEAYVNFQFSLHKYFNDGKHNYNDFRIADFFAVLVDFGKKFQIDPLLARLHNIEFGVNVLLPFETSMLLNSIINYKGRQADTEQFKGNGYLLRFVFDQYELKIYDKGRQYQLASSILRIEIRVKKMQFLKSKGIEIRDYGDLLAPEKVKRLSELLIHAFRSLLFYDNSVQLKAIKNRKDLELLLAGRNPSYWSSIEDPNTFKKKRLRFKVLISKYGTSQIQSQVIELIKKKIQSLTKVDAITRQNINDYLRQNRCKTAPEITIPIQLIGREIVPEITTLTKISRNTIDTQINCSSIWLNRHPFQTFQREFGRPTFE